MEEGDAEVNDDEEHFSLLDSCSLKHKPHISIEKKRSSVPVKRRMSKGAV